MWREADKWVGSYRVGREAGGRVSGEGGGREGGDWRGRVSGREAGG